jgi:hypothetical protein
MPTPTTTSDGAEFRELAAAQGVRLRPLDEQIRRTAP